MMAKKSMMMKKSMPSRMATDAAFREVNANEPAIVGKTRRKKGTKAAAKQKVAIALSKARRGFHTD